ncbi:MAG: DUF4271 domain-containing protein [Bacteroidales bacterium]|jgi:hypothetical protein|nr:DUF4271 domain-containing protein [Bacteroidales bacterium]
MTPGNIYPQDFPIYPTNNTFVWDSLQHRQNSLSYEDSLWNVLQTSLYLNPPTTKQEETHFLVRQTAKPFEDLSYPSSGFDWFFVISLIFLSLLVIIRLRLPKIFSTSYDSLQKGKLTDSNYAGRSSSSKQLAFLLPLCYWIGISLILYVFMCFCVQNNYLDISQTDENFILKFSFIFIVIYFVMRFVLHKAMSILFNIKNTVSEYQHLLGYVDFVLVMLSFPFVFVYTYYGMPSSYGEEYPLLKNISLILIFLIFIVLNTYKMIKGWGIFRRNFRLYEYFLYLCTIEILPLLIFFKFSTDRL